MSRESESEQTQRTVAELLAQYGGGSGEVTPRRRRRRAEETSDTAPQAIIDRVNSDSGRLRAIRDEPEPPPAAPPPPPPPLPQRQRSVDAERTAYQPPPPPLSRPEPPAARPEPPVSRLEPPAARLEPPPARLEPPQKAETGRRRAPEVDPAEETRVVPPVVADYQGEPSRPSLPAPPVKPEPSRSNLVRPVPPGAPPAVKPPVREPATEVMPRITDKLTPNVPLESLPTESVLIVPPAPPRLPDPLPDQTAEDWFGDDEPEEVVEQESTAFHPYVDLDEEDEDDDYPSRDFQRRDLDDDEPAGLADLDDDLDDERPADRSAGKEWLLMIGQLAAGVIGGAALWLGFNFLWRTAAPAALVVALAVTVGLVMMVRKIRRADDLQTTVLAVLVGLIVTVSPAAMLLVNS
ncbi:hypothetical protein LZG04_13715 [Saccharothrix sp. S26]|uniref:hypothetical protein n=1 Tax=Saccharothrix sp. S26 TaxID=2907215 RepID=UPI001F229BE6|nr:hypothetical protein [Saccharothrix sp. S26]MCE6995849.1 hypothetical protein [Saccharothrix sp. S26]